MAPASFFQNLQQTIVKWLESIDEKNVLQDAWQKPQNNHQLYGEGLSCILERGSVFERAGVGFSHVKGEKLPPSATAVRPELKSCPWEATGISLVFHPLNPYVPTVHANLRCFTAYSDTVISWFGGGMDLTPYYGFVEDAKHFHQTCHDVLKPFGEHLYPLFKRNCDAYFYLPHRKEARGIGGIFFDDFSELGWEQSFAMVKAIGENLLYAYAPILLRRKDMSYGEKERKFQLYRRGRYVEFNLVYDRGTLFGLQSGGRSESILMSMPPTVTWQYDWNPEPSSREEELYQNFLVPQNWISL